MAKSSKFTRAYVKYIIKMPFLFYLFLFVGVTVFLFMTLSLKLDVLQTYAAVIADNTVTISGEPRIVSDTIYLYNNKNEKIYKVKAENIRTENGSTVFETNVTALGDLSGNVSVDLVIGSQTLFERIFVKAGKG